MNLTVSTTLVNQFRSQRNIFAGILGVCLLLNVLQGLERLTVCEKTIILPPDIQQGVWIQKNKISQSFLEEWGVYLAQLWLNVSPSTIAYQKDLLLRHVGPDSYGEISNMIDIEADHLRKNQASTTFLVKNLVVNTKDMTVTLSGFQATYLGKERVSDTPLSVRLFFRLERAGKLELINLKRLGKEETK